MKIIIISFSDFIGGASIAAHSIFKSLKKMNKYFFTVHAQNKSSIEIYNILGKSYIYFLRIIEKVIIKFFLKKKFHQSLNIFYTNISKKINFHNADIVNIHWVNRSMMSLNDIKNINSKVVISLHDMWFLRSTEHYSLNNEPLLRDKVSDYCQKKKKEIVKQANVFFIAHNQWMLSQFNKTYPGNKNKIFLCKNYPINTNIFKPRNKKNLRKKYNIPIKKKIIFFSAQDTSDFRKGYNHFINVVEKLKNEKNILFISVGRHRKDLDTIKNLKQIDFLSHDKICEIYSLSDIFVCTSVIDNLPLTVLEALASGNVVFSFKNGGVNKILDKVGFSYDLNKKNQLINDLKKISLPQIRSKSYKSRSFALKNFNYQSISSQYNKIFKKII